MHKLIEILKSNILVLTLIITNILFVIYFTLLAFYSRPHFDDLHFMWATREYGIFGFVEHIYQTGSGRFVMFFIVGIVAKLQTIANSNLLIPIVYSALGFLATNYVWNKIAAQKTTLLSANTILLFYNIYIISSFDFAVFNWYAGTIYYIIAPIVLYMFYLINTKSFNATDITKIIITSIFIGGVQEAYTMIVLSMLVLNCMLLYLKNKSVQTIKPQIKKIGIALFFILSCLAIVIIAPGNYVRMNLPEFNVKLTIVQFILEIIKTTALFGYFTIFNFVYIIAIFLIFLWQGAKMKNKFQLNLNFKSFTLYSLGTYLLFILANVLPAVYLWGNMGVQRHYILASYFTLIYGCIVLFIVGHKYIKHQWIKKVEYLTVVFLIAISTIQIINLKQDYPTVKAYANEIDERIENLKKLNNDGVNGVIKINPLVNLPYTADCKYVLLKALGKDQNRPVLYYISDVDTNVVDYGIHIRKLYKLNFDIIRQDVN